MRGFIYIFALMGVFFLCGLHNDVQAKSPEEILSGLESQEGGFSVEQLEGVMAKLDSEVGLDNLMAALQKAVDKHPQLAELVLIMQEYGVLKEITVPEKQRQAFQKKLAQQ